MTAHILGLAIREKPRAPMQALGAGEITVARGLVGDFRGARSKNRKVTVLFREQWDAACFDSGLDPAKWLTRRANILVEGLENPREVGATLRIGEALLEVYCECDPCNRMDAQHPGLASALDLDWRGGVCCRVMEGGTVKIGDQVARERDGAGARSITANPQAILDFWLREIGPKQWYKPPAGLDDTIRAKFEQSWFEAGDGLLDSWMETPEGALATLILLDQFPRNMFRGTGRAFSTDYKALKLAKQAIAAGHDLQTPEPQRQFFYLPMMHAEDLAEQNSCITLIRDRMPETGDNNRYHALVHRAIIERFGRFPARNAALERENTPQEQAYLAAGKYEPEGWKNPDAE